MGRAQHVDSELDQLFRVRARRAAFIGAALFLLVAPLDFVTYPEHAARFLALRGASAAGLVFLGTLLAWARGGLAVRALVLLGTVASAGVIEAMVLATGGATSPYAMGMPVLALLALGLLPGDVPTSSGIGVALFAVFVVPLALVTPQGGFRDLVAQGYLLLAVLTAAAVIGRVNRAATARAAGLAYEMAERELALAQEVDLRTAQLRTAASEWRATVDSTGDLILLLDESWNIVRVNEAAATLAGRPFADVIGRCVSEVELFAGLPCDDGLLERMHRARIRVEAELRCAGRDFLVSAEPIPAGRAQAGGAVVIARDVTELKAMEREVAQAADRTRRILERAPFGVLVVDAQLRVTFANPAILAIAGYTHDEFVGASLAGFPGCRELGMAPRIGEALAGTPFRFGPTRFTCHAGGRATVANFTGFPFDEDGHRRVLLFVEDVTDLDRAEEARRALGEQLRQAQKMEAIGTLASGIAHDFNNVLLAVIGLSDAAAERLDADHPARGDLEAVVGAAERGSDLVRQLLAFGRQQDLKTQALDANRVVAATCRMLRPMLPRCVALAAEPTAGAAGVIADPVQLEQVLVNLVLNARDAMPEGGPLVVATGSARVAPNDAAHAGVLPGDYVTIAVRDRGTGIAPEHLERIFDPFFTTKPPGEGSGLGLATAYGIVSQHGGALRVESAPGAGSTFTVYLPASELAAVEGGSDRPPAGGSETVLFVDDDPRARLAIGRRLEQLGYRVLTATDGEEALPLAHDGVGLLLCDVVLPGAGARHVAAAVRAAAPRAAVLFLSGHPEELLAERGLLAPGERFVAKSLGPDGVARRVREALDRRAAGLAAPGGRGDTPGAP